jgi:hypothetical protein
MKIINVVPDHNFGGFKYKNSIFCIAMYNGDSRVTPSAAPYIGTSDLAVCFNVY